jgi:hypothetical protein
MEYVVGDSARRQHRLGDGTTALLVPIQIIHPDGARLQKLSPFPTAGSLPVPATCVRQQSTGDPRFPLPKLPFPRRQSSPVPRRSMVKGSRRPHWGREREGGRERGGGMNGGSCTSTSRVPLRPRLRRHDPNRRRRHRCLLCLWDVELGVIFSWRGSVSFLCDTFLFFRKACVIPGRGVALVKHGQPRETATCTQ